MKKYNQEEKLNTGIIFSVLFAMGFIVYYNSKKLKTSNTNQVSMGVRG